MSSEAESHTIWFEKANENVVDTRGKTSQSLKYAIERINNLSSRYLYHLPLSDMEVEQERPEVDYYQFTSNKEKLSAFPVIKPDDNLHPKDAVISLQKWEGYVLEIKQEEFSAKLLDLTNPNIEEEAIFSIENVSQDDRKLIRIGAVFYWGIGQKTDSAKRLSTVSELRFRRLPNWTEEEIEKAKEESKKLSELFGIHAPSVGHSQER